MIQFDFNTIKQRMLTTLSSKTEWAEFLAYGTNSLLLDTIAQEMAYQAQYKEYLTYENWWSLARNKSSLLVEAPVHGYVVPRKKGAVGTLKISSSETYNATYPQVIYIPKYFQFSNGDTFVVANDNYTINPADMFSNILAVQGEYKLLTFQALGNLFETKDIIDDSVENTLFTLFVNDVLYTKVDTLFEYGPTDLVYEIITSPDFSKITLRFGNDIFGKKLSLNDVVKFQYVTTLGSTGNILTTNNIDTVESQAYDALGQPVDLYVTNEVAFTGGEDYPTIEEIRALSPKVYQTGDRASSRTDYETMISQLTYISKVAVWGAYETNVDANLDPWTFIPSEENVIHVGALNTSYTNLSPTEQADVVNSIYTRASPTDLLKFEDVEAINLIFNVAAVAQNSSYQLSTIKTTIESLLDSTYGIANAQFNNNIYNSDLVRLIDEVPGVRNHNTTVQIRKQFVFTSAYVSSIQLPVYPINATSTKFYIKKTSELESQYVLLATTAADGTITGEAGYNTVGSSMNVSNGLGTLLVNSGLTDTFSAYNIKVVYQSNANDLILNARNNIFQYYTSNVTVTYPV